MLGAVLVVLILKARKEEAQAASVPVEKVMTARLSPTRVMAPKDLDASASSVEIPATARTKDREISVHPHILIRNRGTEAYHNVMLKFICIGTGGKIVATQTMLVPDMISPGQTLTPNVGSPEGIPGGTVRCVITILYSDLGPAPETK